MINGLPPRMSESAFRSFENYARSMTVDGPFGDSDGQVVFYDVEDRYGRRRRYLVWRGPDGIKGVMGEGGETMDAGAVACVIRELDRVPEGPDDMMRRARGLPDEIAADPMFDISLETEPRDGEDNDAVRSDHVFAFLKDLFAPPIDADHVLNVLDTAVEASVSCTRYDASPVADLLSAYGRIGDAVAEASPSGLSGLLCSRRAGFHQWIVPYLPRASQAALVTAFIDLSELKDIRTEDLGIADALLYPIEDRRSLAAALMDGLSFYDAQDVIRREARRYHTDLAKDMAGMLQDVPDLDQHLREAALLTRELGMPDSGGLFIRSFIQEPNGKRLIDVRDAHPDIDMDDLMSRAFESAAPGVGSYVFFARNGLADRVAEEVYKGFSGDEDDEGSGALLLAETLLSYDEPGAALTLAEKALETMIADDSLEAHAAMTFIESNFGDREDVRTYARDVRRRYSRKKGLWRTYDEEGGGIFSLRRRSTPKRSFASESSMILGDFASAFRSMLSSLSSTDLLISPDTSKSRSSKNSRGSSSNLAPIPYRTAATCLHMYAESGQEQRK